MADRTFTYRVVVDSKSAGSSAAQARSAIERELGKVQFAPQLQSPRTLPASPTSPTTPARRGGGSFSGNLAPGMDFSQLTGLSIGGYAVTEMVRATLEAGKLGAENMRLARSYEQLAQGAGLAGDALVQKLSKATQQTVTEQKLMASTNMLLAAAQEGQIDVTEDQIATLAKFARLRSTQLTANGRPMSTEEAYGRLIQGTIKRETELLDELGLSTKSIADVIGVPVNQINRDVETLLDAITQVAEIEIERFGEPILDEATRIEQAATRIEEAKNRINAALAGPTAWAYEAGAFAVEEMTFSGNNPYRESILADPNKTAKSFQDRADSALVGGEDFERMAEVLRGTNAAMSANMDGADALGASVMQLARDMMETGTVTDEQRERLQQLEVQLRVTSSGGIVLAQTNREIGESAAYAAGHVFDLAAGIFQVAENGQLVKLPTFGPMTAPPNLPNDNAVEGMFGGGLLGSVLQGPDAFQRSYGSAWQQEQDEADRRAEQAEREAIREGERVARQAESDWKEAANNVESAFRDAASELESSLRAIPGLFGTSEVTQEQLDLAAMGVPQNFVDDVRRRANDEVLNGVDYADINPASLFARAGIDPALDPKAQLAIFNQKWADSSLFADPANLDLLNQDAVAAEMERQRQSELGQSNILGAFGLGEDGEGAYFKDLGSIMQNGMMAGAEEGLASFSTDAIGNVMMQLKSEAALVEYANTGFVVGDALFGGILDGATGSGLVSAIVAEALRQLNDVLPPAP